MSDPSARSAAPRFILASASPARLSVLRAAGVSPFVRVSEVDEDAVQGKLGPDAAPDTVVTELARAKALDVFTALTGDPVLADAVIVGCDSMLHIDDELLGKPHSVDIARERWRAMRGGSGELLTGHSLLRVRGGVVVGEAADHCGTLVRFGTPSDEDLEAYLATGEPLKVAGAFTLDGLGGWFVDGIEGDPSSVIGIGLPLVRELLGRVGLGIAQLWAGNPPASA
ncbi:Maf family protein [Tomitella biformata]|uniref:Maf family protein n=1 Tax=Tomitella biformata TaxID=630403 RepID=UPI0004B70E88|nr:Maf family protein [Tomitella biformata]